MNHSIPTLPFQGSPLLELGKLKATNLAATIFVIVVCDIERREGRNCQCWGRRLLGGGDVASGIGRGVLRKDEVARGNLEVGL